MEKLTIEEINALPLTEKERKSNEAFAKLASIIKHYNEGWKPTKSDLGYFVYSRRLFLLWSGNTHNGSDCDLSYAYSNYVFSDSPAGFMARLAIKDYDLCKFMAENYEQLYKDFWMED